MPRHARRADDLFVPQARARLIYHHRLARDVVKGLADDAARRENLGDVARV